MTQATANTAYPPALADAIARGRELERARIEEDARLLAGRRDRFRACYAAVLDAVPVGAWLYDRREEVVVSMGTNVCWVTFGGLPRTLRLFGSLTADGCVAVRWQVYHVSMRDDVAFKVEDWERALAAAAEPV